MTVSPISRSKHIVTESTQQFYGQFVILPVEPLDENNMPDSVLLFVYYTLNLIQHQHLRTVFDPDEYHVGEENGEYSS